MVTQSLPKQGSSRFARYIGIDYSGAKCADSSLKGLRVYEADREQAPREMLPRSGRTKYWNRRSLSEWLIKRLGEAPPILVGIDHGFSFPLRYFETHQLPPGWPGFLGDFQRHWPTDAPRTSVEMIRQGVCGAGKARSGHARWRRLCEERARAKSVFHFDVPGSVAKSTHAGLPWLLRIRQALEGRVHFWPFDGWDIPRGCSVITEAYPALWSRSFPREDRNPDQHDAYAVTAWTRETDLAGHLDTFFRPPLLPEHREMAEIEGWILGIL